MHGRKPDYTSANDFKVDKASKPDETYYDLTKNKLIPLITTGIVKAIHKYKELMGEDKMPVGDENVSVELGTTMTFYFGEDECAGKLFYQFESGPVHDASMELQKPMEKQTGTTRRQAVFDLFDAACDKIDINDSRYDGISLTLWVPEAGCDPFIRNVIRQNPDQRTMQRYDAAMYLKHCRDESTCQK